jgi:signal transduction histidine kinase
MRSLPQVFATLQVRLLAALVGVVVVALGTVALVARTSTTSEFLRYVAGNREDMQAVAKQIAATTGDRLLVTTTQGRVMLDSADELTGQRLGPADAAAPGPGPAWQVPLDQATFTAAIPPPNVDVLFVREANSPADGPVKVARVVTMASSSAGTALPTDAGATTAAAGPIGSSAAGVPIGSSDAAALPTAPAPAVMGASHVAAPPATFVFRPGVDSTMTSPALFDREQGFVTAVTRSLLIGVLVGGLAAVLFAIVCARAIVRPIDALTSAARRMSRGDLSQRVPIGGRDEIGQLALAFNAMADGLARTEDLRRTMVADTAHELRTPLTNLRGYLEAIRDGVVEPGRETIDSLYEEAVLLSHLVDDLQELSLSDAGRLSLQAAAVEPAALLQAAALALAPRAAAQEVELIVAPAQPTLPHVQADVHRLGQVLRNLLSNALAYTPAGGTIWLTATRRGSMVQFEVRDTGCGIAPAHVPNVFERFYRADPARARQTGGAGLGLALVKDLVAAHGGTVGVASVEGQGSSFSFTIPVASGGVAS